MRKFAAAVGMAIFASGVLAQTYPSKTITLLSNSATGTSEAAYRSMIDNIKERTGANIIFEARPGASGASALQAIKRATPDGHTIGITYAGALTLNPLVTPELDLDAIKDFAPVTRLMSFGLAIAMREDYPAKNFAELLAMAKAKPESVKFGIASTNNMTWLLMLRERGGAHFLPVPFKTSAESITMTLGGHIDGAFFIPASVVSQKGKLRALAYGGSRPNAALPGVPLVRDTFPGLDFETWFGVIAPAAIQPAQVAWLQRAFVQALRQPNVLKILESGGMDALGDSTADFAKVIRDEVENNRGVVRKYDVKG